MALARVVDRRGQAGTIHKVHTTLTEHNPLPWHVKMVKYLGINPDSDAQPPDGSRLKSRLLDGNQMQHGTKHLCMTNLEAVFLLRPEMPFVIVVLDVLASATDHPLSSTHHD